MSFLEKHISYPAGLSAGIRANNVGIKVKTSHWVSIWIAVDLWLCNIRVVSENQLSYQIRFLVSYGYKAFQLWLKDLLILQDIAIAWRELAYMLGLVEGCFWFILHCELYA